MNYKKLITPLDFMRISLIKNDKTEKGLSLT